MYSQPRAAGRRARGHVVEPLVGDVEGVQAAGDPRALLQGVGAGAVGVVGDVAGCVELGVDPLHVCAGQQCGAAGLEQCQHLGVRRLRTGRWRPGWPRPDRRSTGSAASSIRSRATGAATRAIATARPATSAAAPGVTQTAGREAPDPVDEDPHAEPGDAVGHDAEGSRVARARRAGALAGDAARRRARPPWPGPPRSRRGPWPPAAGPGNRPRSRRVPTGRRSPHPTAGHSQCAGVIEAPRRGRVSAMLIELRVLLGPNPDLPAPAIRVTPHTVDGAGDRPLRGGRRGRPGGRGGGRPGGARTGSDGTVVVAFPWVREGTGVALGDALVDVLSRRPGRTPRPADRRGRSRSSGGPTRGTRHASSTPRSRPSP